MSIVDDFQKMKQEVEALNKYIGAADFMEKILRICILSADQQKLIEFALLKYRKDLGLDESS